ncbi:hypothetical protein BC939DRAFT_464565 [Gamsiella multidivaricata]|uniref:uncharacterized protein n=1 Tax=Gamsiella multidivaricata TaxID=101098 RepID=UPI0022201BE6|nr:uncharacterized protein BC939DRAFT_464565 [Gamsiella multidivaricata]KAI7817837.1 hypothetical protein BC939DRAFT_464565 [Gamsiella multidivaricata]
MWSYYRRRRDGQLVYQLHEQPPTRFGGVRRIQTIEHNTIQYNTIQSNTKQYNTIRYNTIQWNRK